MGSVRLNFDLSPRTRQLTATRGLSWKECMAYGSHEKCVLGVIVRLCQLLWRARLGSKFPLRSARSIIGVASAGGQHVLAGYENVDVSPREIN